MARSRRVALEHIPQVKLALQRKKFPSQQALAEEMGMARATISNFLNGKPVDFLNFVEICEKLGLDWEAIADLDNSFPETDRLPDPPQEPKKYNTNFKIDELVKDVCNKVKPLIEERCGTMRVLNMTQPIGVNAIYTTVNILYQLTAHRSRKITELLQNFDPDSETFDRCGLGEIYEPRVDGQEALLRSRGKLVALGKPGAGKTTFLKYLAILHISERCQNNLVPVFIPLMEFGQASNQLSLLEFITQMLGKKDVKGTELFELLNHGKVLVLLDGLDEVVKEEDRSKVLKDIQEFADWYPANQFVITCRIAAEEYNFQRFTEVEVADFDDEQIKTFVKKWFDAREKPEYAERFMQQMKADEPIKELAKSPLLLTLLCIEFEASGDLARDRAELYKRCINTLMRTWDDQRNIKRQEIYKELSVQKKADLLSEIAWITFEGKQYFFKQRDVERYIYDYICNLRNAKTATEDLELDSEAVLKSIEAHHGLLVERAINIYSFSHLTVHEYFTARYILTNANPKALDDKILQNLSIRITEPRWREVFLFTVGLLPSAECLLMLMKQQVDRFIAEDEKLQQFLSWVNQKSLSLQLAYKPALLRSFFLNVNLALNFDRALACTLDITGACIFASAGLFACVYDLENAINHALDLAHEFEYILQGVRKPAYAIAQIRRLTIERMPIDNLPSELGQALQKFKEQLSAQDSDEGTLSQLWEEHGQDWTKELVNKIVTHRKVVDDDWQFNEEQVERLKRYYNANQLLVECLNSDCYVSREVRQEIEDTLLLPITEIERLKNKG
jgi:predicted NACHT family NTPase/transcriptional regulator with XRE-family HTH domain